MWNIVNVSAAGTSHETNNLPCQDSNAVSVFETETDKILIAVVSDGAGSAARAEVGSSFICRKFVADVENFLKSSLVEDINADFFKSWVIDFQKELRARVKAEGASLRDCACTFLAAIISENRACFAQIGDGALVVKDEENGYSFVFIPQQGEFVNQTFFATELNAPRQLEFVNLERRIDDIALFTDGIQNLVLDLRANTTNRPLAKLNFESFEFKVVDA